MCNKLILKQALKGPAPDGGLWNGRKVADYLSELIGQPISRQLGWEYLKQMRMRLRVPRPQHQEADPDEQETWKKKLQEQVEKIQVEHPNAAVEVWSEDEHRIGLHPIMRRIWVEQGEQPIATVNWKREWLWLYAFVQPQTGQTKGVDSALCQYGVVQPGTPRLRCSLWRGSGQTRCSAFRPSRMAY